MKIITVFIFVICLAAHPARGAAPHAPAENLSQNNAKTAADIHDIRPIRHPGFDPARLIYGSVVLAAAITAGMLVCLWKRRRRRLTGAVAATPPPEAAALCALDELADVDEIDARRFYFRMSAVLKRYLGERYDIPASEMTTEELLPEMDRLGVDHDRTASLGQLFMDADRVKYAGRPAAVGRMKEDLAFARQFIRQTTPAAGDGDAG